MEDTLAKVKVRGTRLRRQRRLFGFGRDVEMARASMSEAFTWAASAASLVAVLVSVWAIFRSEPGSPARDLLLVISGALLAASIGASAFGVRAETDARSRYDAQRLAAITERIGNALRLEKNHSTTLNLSAPGREKVELTVPLYRLSSSEASRSARSELVTAETRSDLEVDIWLIEEFNMLADRTIQIVDAIAMAPAPTPDKVALAKALCDGLEKHRLSLAERFPFGDGDKGEGVTNERPGRETA